MQPNPRQWPHSYESVKPVARAQRPRYGASQPWLNAEPPLPQRQLTSPPNAIHSSRLSFPTPEPTVPTAAPLQRRGAAATGSSSLRLNSLRQGEVLPLESIPSRPSYEEPRLPSDSFSKQNFSNQSFSKHKGLSRSYSPVSKGLPGGGATLGNKVTPLSRRSKTPQRSNPQHPGAIRRRNGSPRRSQAPLPLLYGIRLLILGVGIAAISGTLLSVLSPNTVPPPSLEQPTPTTSSPRPSSQALSRATTIRAVTLKQEMTRLKTELEQLATLTPGLTQSVFVVNLDSGAYVDIAGAEAVSAASTIKLPILVAFLQSIDSGDIGLTEALALKEEHLAGGSGDFQADPVGKRYTALEVATQMIVNSDNTATNILIDRLGGQEALNQRFSRWGLTATVLRNPLPDLEGANTTSAQDLALLLGLIDQGGLLSLRSRDRLLTIMQSTYNRSLIPSGVHDAAIVANKTGDIATILADTALVNDPNGTRYALAALVARPENDGRAAELLRRVAERVDTEMNQPYAPVGVGAAPILPAGFEDAPPPAPTSNSSPGGASVPSDRIPQG